MNAYWYPADPIFGPCIRLDDTHGEYLLALGSRRTYLILRHRDRVFAGEILDKIDLANIGESVGPDGKRGITAEIGDRPAADITETTVGRGAGRYFGRIDGEEHPLRFLPAGEAPEEKIAKLR